MVEEGQNENSKTEHCKMLTGQAPEAEHGQTQRGCEETDAERMRRDETERRGVV